MAKLRAVIILNNNFVGRCNFTEDGERYLNLSHKMGVTLSDITDIFQRGYVYVDGQIIPTTSIGSMILLED